MLLESRLVYLPVVVQISTLSGFVRIVEDE